MKKLQKQAGFTLIELVIVIVILGILAATAAPKFIDLTGDAKKSVIQGVQGTINSAMNLAHAKAIVSSQTGATGQVVINGQYYALIYGYPTVAGAGTPAGTVNNGWGIDRLVELSNGSDIVYAAGVYSHDDAADPTKCKVTYADASGSGSPVIVTPASAEIDVTDC
ncbi:prepilin-type N-terminal cleavage/methylation domain-containing protein [Colwellia sp. BRX10-4]|jgi:MSHA pilin protein MshA|uniref:pilus assembly FimT family protein n=1 Tax=Colwellia sp. BRX10-4 TaxID=2759843 RepID=UPI0015F69695|nr:prepilin-type N-terminal cleavage/methylation domain-containing protein [Colwellia sp. BRX10-4]MBA6397748.1 prepilin-type N-terminal cleavage/methylation domain-containing protein [Colwellia sp. BRX10-4]